MHEVRSEECCESRVQTRQSRLRQKERHVPPRVQALVVFSKSPSEILPSFSFRHRDPSDHRRPLFYLPPRRPSGRNAFPAPSRAGSSFSDLDGCCQGWVFAAVSKAACLSPKCQHEAEPLAPSPADLSRPGQCLRRSLAVSPASPRLCDALFPMTTSKANATWGLGRLTPARPKDLSLGFCSILPRCGSEFLSTIATFCKMSRLFCLLIMATGVQVAASTVQTVAKRDVQADLSDGFCRNWVFGGMFSDSRSSSQNELT